MTKQAAETVRESILRKAVESGDTVLHSWVHDLEDGSFNVAAIIKFHEGNTATIGINIA